MKEETQETIADRVFKWVETTAQNINDFAHEQIPPFIEEFLMWRFLEHGVNVGIWVLFTSIPIAIILFCKKHLTIKDFDEVNPITLISLILAGVLGVMSFCWFFSGGLDVGSLSVVDNIKQMVKIKVAPKVYLVEEAVKIIK